MGEEYSLDAAFYSWALAQWSAEVAKTKANLFNFAAQLLFQVALRIGTTQFVLGEENKLTLVARSSVVALETQTPKKSRKRTQSDLSTDSLAVPAPSSAVALCDAAVQASMAIAAGSAGSPMIAALLSSAIVLDSFQSVGWFGQWARCVVLSATTLAARKVTTISSELTQFWENLADLVVASNLQVEDGTASSELQAIALHLTKLVNVPALRALVVDTSVNTQSLTDLPRLEGLQGTARDAPQLARLDPVLEDVLRSASTAQISSAILAQLQDASCEAPLEETSSARHATLGLFRGHITEVVVSGAGGR